MNVTGKHLERVARKLGYRIKPGRKHTLVYTEDRLITTLPRGRIKSGTLAAILKGWESVGGSWTRCCDERVSPADRGGIAQGKGKEMEGQKLNTSWHERLSSPCWWS